MMYLATDSNLGKFEKIARLTLGAVLIGMVMQIPNAPVWLALVATYPIFTAILAWDPIYAGLETRKQKPTNGVRWYGKKCAE
jgi:hypothetical protein